MTKSTLSCPARSRAELMSSATSLSVRPTRIHSSHLPVDGVDRQPRLPESGYLIIALACPQSAQDGARRPLLQCWECVAQGDRLGRPHAVAERHRAFRAGKE